MINVTDSFKANKEVAEKTIPLRAKSHELISGLITLTANRDCLTLKSRAFFTHLTAGGGGGGGGVGGGFHPPRSRKPIDEYQVCGTSG